MALSDAGPAFYAYAYPEPEASGPPPSAPAGRTSTTGSASSCCPYDAVRAAADPDAAVLAFLQSTYEAGADLGGWDRSRPRARRAAGAPAAQAVERGPMTA